MSHTLHGNPFTTFHFNGDFSGDIEIVRFGGTSQEERLCVPMEAIDVLYAEKLRRARIAAIEQQTTEQILDSALRGY